MGGCIPYRGKKDKKRVFTLQPTVAVLITMGDNLRQWTFSLPPIATTCALEDFQEG